MRRAGRQAAIFTLFLLLAIALTWPLAANLGTAVSDRGDPLLNAWILDWTAHALLTQPLHLFDAPTFHPSLLPLAYSEHLAGVALLVLPFHLAGVSAIALHNIAMLLGFALSGYGAFVLARLFVPQFIPCLVAGIFYAFVSFKFDHLPHLQIISSGWIPLTLAALVLYWRDATPRNALLFAGAFVMNGLSNVYYLLFVSAALGMTLVFFLAAAPRRDRRFWLTLLAACALAAAVLLPFLLPYRTVSKAYGLKRQAHEVLSNGWTGWLVPAPRSLLYGNLPAEAMRMPENSLFPGVVPLVLVVVASCLWSDGRSRPSSSRYHPAAEAAAAPQFRPVLDTLILLLSILFLVSLMRDRVAPSLFGIRLFAIRGSDLPFAALFTALLVRLPLREWLARSRFSTETWMAIVWMLVGFAGSFGMRTPFYAFLFKRLEPFQSLRAVSRFAVVTYAGMIVLVAIGAALLLARRGLVAKSFLVAFAVVDVLPRIEWQAAPATVPPVYRWLRQGPVLELPIESNATFLYVLWQRHHGMTLLNGTSGFEPPEHIRLREAWEQKNAAGLLDFATELGANVLIVHDHWLDPEQKRILFAEIQQQGLPSVQYFAHEAGGDLVFLLK
ncbi:MAG TPA: hypothetical protein VGF28_09415 [Thermoanaerobaculia bacterium]|jgi:hypothetical protein